MNRTLLRWAALGCGAVMAVAFASPMVMSLKPNARAENAGWHDCEVKDLAPGELRTCGLVKVYRRTQADRENVSRYLPLLEDANSLLSMQPPDVANQWRSHSAEYFVFWPTARRYCPVQFKPSVGREKQDYYWAPEAKALAGLPYFTENCEGRTWDTSGRLYARSRGSPQEKNLSVPETRWISDTRFFVWTPRYKKAA